MSDVPAASPGLSVFSRVILFGMPAALAVVVGYAGLKATEWLNRPKSPPTEFVHAGTEPDGGRLYAIHCARCHGANGDGVGDTPMFPKARHFGYERFKFTDTVNGLKQPQGAAGTLGGIPTDDVLAGIVKRGIDGSPMPAFERETTEEDRLAIVRYVRTRFLQPDRLIAARDEAAMRKEMAAAKEDGEDFDPKKDWPPKAGAKRDKWVENRKGWLSEAVADLTGSEPCPVPAPFPEAKPGYEQRAAVLFNKLGCLGCHGLDGKGTFDANRKNDNGTVAYPRDFTAQIFKGGGQPEHLYRRIYLGIPGTPMKAFGREATPEEIVDLVYYVKYEKFRAFPPAGGTAAQP